MKKTFKLLLSAAILFSATLSANAQLLKKEKFRSNALWCSGRC